MVVERRRTWLIVGGIVVGILVICLAACLAAGVLIWQSPTAETVRDQIEEVETVQEIRTQGPITAPVETAGALDDQLALVREAVITIRGLDMLHDVPIVFLTVDELEDRLDEEFFGDYSPEDARDDAIALSAFDLLSADFDLYGFYLDLYAEQVAGYYDPADLTIYLISGSDSLSATDESIYAHEFTHLLQDQHFDLEAFLPDDEEWQIEHPDETLARIALVEGDATMTQTIYIWRNMPADRIGTLMEEAQELDLPVLDSAPEVITRDLLFPYLEGLAFVQALYASGGYAAVDAAYSDPPTSTEQILHPEQYITSRDDPQEVSLADGLDVLGDDYRLVYEQPLGEFYLSLYLETLCCLLQRRHRRAGDDAPDGVGRRRRGR
jgi:hypothetical protein